MNGLLVDSNIILDVVLDDPVWADWSEAALAEYSMKAMLYINPIIYTEVSIGFRDIEELESVLFKAGFKMLQLPKEALFLAGKAFLNYKRKTGLKRSPLPDFYIGAHAAVLDLDLITRDVNRYKTYFPALRLVCPER